MGFRPKYSIGELVILKRAGKTEPEKLLHIDKRIPKIENLRPEWYYGGRVYSILQGNNLSFEYSTTLSMTHEENICSLESRLMALNKKK